MNIAAKPPTSVNEPGSDPRTIAVDLPAEQSLPVVLASPHSGRTYPDEFLQAVRLDPTSLRRSEDSFVDELFEGAVGLGAPMIRALFPRVYLDVNREPFELDPGMFEDALPAHVNTRSPRVSAGLGTIARVVGQGQDIYGRRLKWSEAAARIATCHRPYHDRLHALIDATLSHFGYCILIDCHSMPTPSLGQPGGGRRVDFVLGDCHGTACAPLVTDTAVEWLRARGFTVDRNVPYAGGYTTRHYGRPKAGIHALQIEIGRSLYMDEGTLTRLPGLARLASQMRDLVAALGRIDASHLSTQN